MVKVVMHVVLNYTREVLHATQFYSFSANAVTFVGCQSWIFVHGYVVIDWRCMAILLNLEMVVDGGMANNLMTVIVKTAKTYGGLIAIDIQVKLIILHAIKPQE